MASKHAHHLTGWAAGLAAAAVVSHSGGGGPFYVWSLVAGAMAISGATAPDWLEVAWWTKRRTLWITHRTLTHWGLAWIALWVVCYRALGHSVLAAPGFGFATGGLMHLLADWPNPLGIPWIFRRHSLNLWNSGRGDSLVVAAAWCAALLVSDHVWFHDRQTLHMLHDLWVTQAQAGANHLDRPQRYPGRWARIT